MIDFELTFFLDYYNSEKFTPVGPTCTYQDQIARLKTFVLFPKVISQEKQIPIHSGSNRKLAAKIGAKIWDPLLEGITAFFSTRNRKMLHPTREKL